MIADQMYSLCDGYEDVYIKKEQTINLGSWIVRMILDRIYCSPKERKLGGKEKSVNSRDVGLTREAEPETRNSVRYRGRFAFFAVAVVLGRGYPWPESIINRLARVPRCSLSLSLSFRFTILFYFIFDTDLLFQSETEAGRLLLFLGLEAKLNRASLSKHVY